MQFRDIALFQIAVEFPERARVVLRLVFFDARVACIRTRGEQHERRRDFHRLHLCLPAPLAEQQRRDDCRDGRTERPLVALDRLPGKACVCFVFFHFAEAVGDDLLHLRRAVLQVNVEASARFRNFAHARLVELRLHILPLVVAQEFRPAAPAVAHRDERAIRRAEADGENVEAFLARARRHDGIGLQFLAIGKYDQRPVLALAFAECLVRRLDRVREIRPAARDDVRVQLLQRLAHRAEIRRERRLQKRRARECEQPDAITLDLVQQILRGELRAREAVRQEVRREHGIRRINRDDHIAPALPFFLPREAPLWTRQRHERQCKPEQQQRKTCTPPRGAHAAREPRLQACRDEPVQRHAPHFLRVKNQPGEKRQRGERPQELRLCEVEIVHLRACHAIGVRGLQSTNGAKHTSPGQRPGKPNEKATKP